MGLVIARNLECTVIPFDFASFSNNSSDEFPGNLSLGVDAAGHKGISSSPGLSVETRVRIVVAPVLPSDAVLGAAKISDSSSFAIAVTIWKQVSQSVSTSMGKDFADVRLIQPDCIRSALRPKEIQSYQYPNTNRAHFHNVDWVLTNDLCYDDIVSVSNVSPAAGLSLYNHAMDRSNDKYNNHNNTNHNR